MRKAATGAAQPGRAGTRQVRSQSAIVSFSYGRLNSAEFGDLSGPEKKQFSELLTKLIRANYKKNLRTMLAYDAGRGETVLFGGLGLQTSGTCASAQLSFAVGMT